MTVLSQHEHCPDLISMTLSEMEDYLSDMGKEKYRAAQVMKWIHQGLVDSFHEMTNLSKTFREELSDRAGIGFPEVADILVSEDGTKKFLLRLPDGLNIETVYMPGDDHDTLCVSSQVGCAMGCRICRTGAMGFKRNLTAGEIVSQLLTVRRALPESRITNIVFMGMGEPLANFDEVVKAVQILTGPNGPKISWRHLTVSTVGLVPRIDDLGRRARVKLAVSLNAVTDEQRNAIMPINKRYPIGELIEALKAYPLPRRDRITIEYVMIRGFNDTDEDARQLVKLLNPIRSKVNLIPFNDDCSQEWRAPFPERVARFQDILLSKSLVAIVRKSRGRDILAACGQLASQAVKNSEPHSG
jgi:23S rRNA (adenine2503-C2)-methyltransferase